MRPSRRHSPQLRRRWLLPTLALLSASVLFSDAYAQYGGAGMGGRMGRGDRGARSDSTGDARSQRADRPAAADAVSYEQIEYRLSTLQQDLKLTADQGGTWQAFADKVRAHAGDLARERAQRLTVSATNAAPSGGLHHIGQAVDAARNRLTALEDIETAAKALYQTLSPAQRDLADLRIVTIVAPRPVAPAAGAG